MGYNSFYKRNTKSNEQRKIGVEPDPREIVSPILLGLNLTYITQKLWAEILILS